MGREGMRRQFLKDYGAAVGLFILAIGIHVAIFGIRETRAPFATFFPAITIAALYGGAGPGLFAIALSTLVVAGRLPIASSPNVPEDTFAWFRIIFFVTNSSIVVAVCEAFRRSRHRTIRAEELARLAEDRRAAAEAAQSDREVMAVTLASIGDGVIVAGLDGRITFLNAAAESLTGWKAADAVGQACHEVFNIIDEKTRQKLENPIAKALSGATEESANHTILIRRDGAEFPIDKSGAAIRDSLGNLRGAALIFRDFSKHKEAERQITESQDRLRFAMEMIGAGAWDLNLADQSVQRSPQHAKIFGYESIQGPWNYEIFLSHVIPDDRDRVRDVVKAAMVSRTDFDFECQIIRRDQQVRWIKTAARFGVGDHSNLVVGVVQDITDFKRALDAVHASEAKHRAIVDGAADGIVTISDRGIIESVNPAAVRIFGYTVEELVGKNVTVLMPEPYYSEHDGYLHHYLATGEKKIIGIGREVQGRRKDGSVFPLELGVGEAVPGDRSIFTGIIRDVTERKVAEQALRNSEERFRLLIEHTPAAIAMLDRDMTYITASKRWLSDFRLAGKDLPGRRHCETFPNAPEQWENIHRQCVAGAIGHNDGESFIHVEGQLEWLRWEVRPWRDAKGEIGGSIIFSELITHRKQMEESLVAARISAETAKSEAERANRAKDHFLAVLSHELRTPLTPVLALAQMMEQDPSISPQWRESAEMIRRNVELESRLIDDLLDLTRISRGKIELHIAATDAHKKMTQVVEICDSDIRSKRLHLTLQLDAVEHHVDADSARLQQIFWNLLRNAVKFTPVGGTITVRSSNIENSQLKIEVEDTGIGIAAEFLPRIFEAFEQEGPEITRLHGGLGLGLSISKTLVALHHGSLSVRSEGKGCGSTFTIVLPFSNHGGDIQGSSRPALPSADNGKPKETAKPRVLLVEDHADTARVISRAISSLGYDVRVATSVAAALQLATTESFSLLVSDVGLPDGSGLDLMRQLRVKSPLRGIALSGFGMDEDIARSRDAGFIEHLTKPVDLQQLEETLQRVINSP